MLFSLSLTLPVGIEEMEIDVKKYHLVVVFCREYLIFLFFNEKQAFFHNL